MAAEPRTCASLELAAASAGSQELRRTGQSGLLRSSCGDRSRFLRRQLLESASKQRTTKQPLYRLFGCPRYPCSDTRERATTRPFGHSLYLVLRSSLFNRAILVWTHCLRIAWRRPARTRCTRKRREIEILPGAAICEAAATASSKKRLASSRSRKVPIRVLQGAVPIVLRGPASRSILAATLPRESDAPALPGSVRYRRWL